MSMSETQRIKNSALLPWPNQWGSDRLQKNMALTALFFGIIFTIAPFYVLSAYHARDYPKMVYGFALVIGSAMFSIFGIMNIRPRSTSFTATITPDGGVASGLRISVAPWRTNFMWIFVTVGLAFFLARSAITIKHLSGDSAGHGPTWTWLDAGQVGVTLIFAIIFAGLMIYLFKTHGRIYLLLTPTAITYQDGRARKTLEWSDVVRTTAATSNGIVIIQLSAAQDSAIKVESSGFLARRARKTYGHLEIPSGYTIDPASLLYAIDFYSRNPELRDELGDIASIDRIARGDLLT